VFIVRQDFLRFGPVAGLLAALALALTPISVATDRNNNLEGLLTLTVLLSA
jgi:4-amino-4-deoxy-L-arabinose transferase-like glycosyltransferase